MREITVYRMRQFFADELKRLELFADLAAGINLEAALLMRRLPTNAAKIVLETRHPSELEAALAAGRLIRKEEDKKLRAAMREDQGFQQERKKSKPNPAGPERQTSGSLAHRGNHCSIGRVNAIVCDLLMREVWIGLMTGIELTHEFVDIKTIISFSEEFSGSGKVWCSLPRNRIVSIQAG